ncbi:isochorismate synthase [Termitidicoccus mucosus]
MLHLPVDPAAPANANPAALRDFLAQCQALAAAVGRSRLVSITLEVPALDPLAVLESIFESGERHFYAERPAENFAIAGAEAVLSFSASGETRFADSRRFIDETLADAIGVGDQAAAFSGPHFFTAYSFFNDTEPGEPFESAGIFIPRWQVARVGDRTTAVANFLVAPDSPLDALVEKVWRAHQKFTRFEYNVAGSGGGSSGGLCGTGDSPVPHDPHGRDAHATQSAHAAPGELQTRERAALASASSTYRAAVTRALELIADGDFQKIVLARAKDIRAAEALHPLRVLNGLRQRFGDCYSFSLANGRGQSFIGASPERLLRVRDGRLLTEALAGSARRGATASEDAALGGELLRNEKDLREHRHVLDSIVRRLAPLGLQLSFSEKPGLRRLANVQHLHTPVEAALPPTVRLLDALARLHPTPAVGGTPREAAIARIRELEDFPRGLYAGAIGWIDSRGGGEFFVGLRTALLEGDRARLYAGAGIVAGSSPEKELAETELKFQAMQTALLGET